MSLLEASNTTVMAGLPWAGFRLGPQRPWQGILAEEHVTQVTHGGEECLTQAVPPS